MYAQFLPFVTTPCPATARNCPPDQLADASPWSYDGGTAIAGPDCEWIVEPVRREETVVLADLGPALIRAQRQNFDPAGH